MFTLKNSEVVDSWFVELKDYNEIEQLLPMNGFNIRNDSSQVAYVELEGRKVGEVQRYSADSFSGRNFTDFKVYNPDGGNFAADEIFVQLSKNELMTSQPFNPQWDMMYFDLDRFSTGCNGRVSLCPLTSADIIKYIVNSQKGIIVQRRLDVFGSANNGSFIIDFGGCDVLNSSVAKEQTVTDLVQYRKTISNGDLDYTETDCTIIGWVIDYYLRAKPDGTTSIATNPDNALDGDMTTFADIETASTPPIDIWEIALDNPMSISDLSFSGYIEDDHTADGTAHHQILTSPDGANWTERGACENTAGDLTYFVHVTDLDLTGITHVKVQGSNTWKTQKIYDVTII